MMNPNLKREKRILNISFIGSFLFLITEIVVAFITKSNAVIMDCVYDFMCLCSFYVQQKRIRPHKRN